MSLNALFFFFFSFVVVILNSAKLKYNKEVEIIRIYKLVVDQRRDNMHTLCNLPN